MLDNPIALRLATLMDAKQIFIWRNHENTRRYFFNAEAIDWDTHLSWFTRVLEDSNRYFLIASVSGSPVGVMRLDCENAVAEIDVYVDPDQVGQGLGTLMLQALAVWAKQNLQGITKLAAKVLLDNKASLKVFEKAGFIGQYQLFEKEL